MGTKKTTEMTVVDAGLTLAERMEMIQVATRQHHDEAIEQMRTATESKLLGLLGAKINYAIDAVLGA